MRLVVLVALAGCYTDLRMGVSAPVGHGHGRAGVDLPFGAGIEHDGERLRAGGGVLFGARLADDNAFVPIGVEGRVAVPLTDHLDTHRNALLAVVHGGVAYADGLDKRPATRGGAPSGPIVQGFVGLGYGGTRYAGDSHFWGGHGALGLSATRFWPDGGDAFWFLGVQLELSLGWNVGGEPL